MLRECGEFGRTRPARIAECTAALGARNGDADHKKVTKR